MVVRQTINKYHNKYFVRTSRHISEISWLKWESGTVWMRMVPKIITFLTY